MKRVIGIIAATILLSMPCIAQKGKSDAIEQMKKEHAEAVGQMKKEFEDGVNQMRQEFDDHVKKMNDEFRDYLSNSFREFQQFTGKERPNEKPKPVTQPKFVPDKEREIRSVPEGLKGKFSADPIPVPTNPAIVPLAIKPSGKV